MSTASASSLPSAPAAQEVHQTWTVSSPRAPAGPTWRQRPEAHAARLTSSRCSTRWYKPRCGPPHPNQDTAAPRAAAFSIHGVLDSRRLRSRPRAKASFHESQALVAEDRVGDARERPTLRGGRRDAAERQGQLVPVSAVRGRRAIPLCERRRFAEGLVQPVGVVERAR